MDLLHSTLNAVGQVGEGIDKFTGGRALRGTLAGKPRELLSVLPFSDTLGLTNAHDQTSGRDLTDAYGVTRKGDSSFGSHAAGFLADNVLSPGNLLSGYGAFKAAPTIAKGLTQGAKALTGLDLIDHIGAGAKGLASKFRGTPAIPSAPHAGWFNPDPGLVSSFEGHIGASPSELVHADLKDPNILDAFHKHFGDKAYDYMTLVGTGKPHLAARTPGYDPGLADSRSKVEGAANEAVNQLAGPYGGSASRNLMHSFINQPDLAASANHAKTAEDFADAMRNGVRGANAYYSPAYYGINKHLRDFGPSQITDEISRIRSSVGAAEGGHATPSLESTEKTVADLLGLIDHSRLPHGMDLYRGVDGPGLQHIEKALGVPLGSPEAVGKEFVDPGFLSTSFDRGTSESFAGLKPGYARPSSGAVFEFPNVPKGKPASYMNPSESEVLFPPGRKIRIDDNSGYPNSIKATLYSALMAALAGRSYNHATQPEAN